MTEGARPTMLQADAASIARAVELLRSGGAVAVPTETVYGLAARADSADAVAAIYRLKGRPDFNPLIVHVSSLEMAESLAELDDRARRLAEAFWPGPLTLVLPKEPGAPLAAAVTAGLPTVALRMPQHPVVQAILADLELPLAAPSANRSGGVSPTSAAHVAQSLGSGDYAILDGGPCVKGLESTIVALRETGWQILRPGPITAARLADLLGAPLTRPGAAVEAPGQLASHYAPGKPMRLDARESEPDEFLIGFAGITGDASLSQSGDLAEAAARLYACLHDAATSDRPCIAVAPIPPDGIGVAINDRLRRAAS